MKRTTKKKINSYGEVQAINTNGKVIEEMYVSSGSYGEDKCHWLFILFEDKTQIRLPLLPEISWSIDKLPGTKELRKG